MRGGIIQRTGRAFSFVPIRFSLGRPVSKIIGLFQTNVKKDHEEDVGNFSKRGPELYNSPVVIFSIRPTIRELRQKNQKTRDFSFF